MEKTELESKKDEKYTCFSLAVDGAVAHVKMVRGKQHNSMNSAFWSEMPGLLDELEHMSAVRVVVLSAEGASFCSGMDFSVFQNKENLSTATAIDRERLRRLILQMQDVFNRIERFRVPVIAAIQGPCIGAGLELVAACDLRFATGGAWFNVHEINLGIMADFGSLQRLPKLLPEGVVRELALTGDRLSAERAERLGFVNAIVADDKLLEHALSVAGKVAQKSPLAISGTRRSLLYARDHSTADALEMAATLQSAIFNADEVVAAVQAQMQKSAASYPDLKAEPIKV